MHVAPWFWFAAVTLIAWGTVGYSRSSRELHLRGIIPNLAGRPIHHASAPALFGESGTALLGVEPHVGSSERGIECL
jgi:hypothetical protein